MEGKALPWRVLARIIHISKDNKSLFCYKQVVKTMFGDTKEASEWLTIAQHSVCVPGSVWQACSGSVR